MDIFEQVKKILCDQLDLDEEQVTEDSEVIDDLGADSLDIVDLVMTLEEELKIRWHYGYDEGAAHKQREIAKNFKQSGIPIEVIVKNTGLTTEEVEKL